MRPVSPPPRPDFGAYTSWLLRSGRLGRLWVLWAAALLIGAALAVLRDGAAPVPATPLAVGGFALRVSALALAGAALHSLAADYLGRAWPANPRGDR